MMVKRYFIFTLIFGLSIPLAACQRSSATVREFDAQALDVRLHGRIAGNPNSGCVLIAINGGPGLTSNYMLDLEQLAGPDCAVVTYDQRGMGKSSEPANPDAPESYTFLYPQRVESLIFFGGGPPTREDIESSQKSLSERVRALIQAGSIPPPDQWTGKGVDPILPAYFSDPTFTFPADSLGGPPAFNQAVYDLTFRDLQKLDLRAGLASLQKPVLMMFGRDDPFGLPMAEATRTALSNASVEFVIIDNCGHFWHECPEGFYPRVREFLRKTENTNTDG